jgi:hypothetical protein
MRPFAVYLRTCGYPGTLACAGCSTHTTPAKAGDFGANPSGATSGTAFPPVGTVLNYSQVFNGTFSLVEHRHTDMINGQKSERSLVNKIL